MILLFKEESVFLSRRLYLVTNYNVTHTNEAHDNHMTSPLRLALGHVIVILDVCAERSLAFGGLSLTSHQGRVL